jgi:LEA14-like dessication related protein
MPTHYYGSRIKTDLCVSCCMYLTRLLIGLLLLASLSGCAGWLTKGEPPEVLVTNITPLDGTAFEQRLQIEVRVRNPNDYDLQVTGMDVRLDLNGKRLARGLSNKEFTVPRLSDALVSIETSTSMLDIARQVVGFRQSEGLTYGISGLFYLTNGRLPFEHSGVLLEQGAFSDVRTPSSDLH